MRAQIDVGVRHPKFLLSGVHMKPSRANSGRWTVIGGHPTGFLLACYS